MEQVDAFEAARILGCGPDEACRFLGGSRAPLDWVEELALQLYPWRRHLDDLDSYWCTVSQAAEQVLGLSVQRVKQLLDGDRIPYVTHVSGARLMRRAQLETVANARLARRLRT